MPRVRFTRRTTSFSHQGLSIGWRVDTSNLIFIWHIPHTLKGQATTSKSQSLSLNIEKQVGWLVMRIYVALALFQPYRNLEVGDNQSLKS